MKLPQLAVPHSKLLFGTKFFTPSVEICGNHSWPSADSASTTSSSHSVPVPLNQNCSRLALAARSLPRAEHETRTAPTALPARTPLPARHSPTGACPSEATSTAPLLMPSAFAQNVIRYHWPWRTLTLPVWQIIAWKSGPSPSNSVQASLAQRLPSRPVSRVSCCWIARFPAEDQSSGTPALRLALLEGAVGDQVGFRRMAQRRG